MASFSTDGRDCIARNIATPLFAHSPLALEDFNAEFEINEICQWINKNGYSKICLQFPDSLLKFSAIIAQTLNDRVTGDIFILGDTTYSNCCVDEVAAMHVQGDAVVHYGHTCFSTSSIPVFTVLPKHAIDVQAVMKVLKNFRDSTSTKICLFYDAAYNHLKDAISSTWYDYYPYGCIAHIDLNKFEERVLGRRISNNSGNVLKLDEIEDFCCVFLGSRSQTVFNCVISIKAQEWHCLEPSTGEVHCLNETQWFKRRGYLIEKCKDAQNIGILVCKLSGQSTKDIIMRIKELCKVSYKKSYIVSVGKPNVAKLANFPEIDLYVMIACPENDLYNSREFYKPLVYPYELEVAVNSNRPVQYNQHIPDFEDLLLNKRAFCAIGNIEVKPDVSLITGKIRETNPNNFDNNVTDLVKTDWAVESIGDNLARRAWTGLEQKLGDTEVKKVEEGRRGLPISYENEPTSNTVLPK